MTQQSSSIRLIALVLIVTLALEPAAPAFAESVVPAGGAAEAVLADPLKFQPPLAFAKLREIHSGKPGSPLIIQIQDAHTNTGAQLNLAAALDVLMTNYNARVVLSEGGSRDCSLDPLKPVAPQAVWKIVAKNHLMRGRITGEEYLNLTTDHPMKILGIEDQALYIEGLQRYREVTENRDRAVEYLSRIRLAVEKLKNRLYPEILKTYESKQQNASDGALSHQALLKLAESQDISLAAYPGLTRLQTLTEREARIDFNRARLEQAALIHALTQKGARAELENEWAKAGGAEAMDLSQFAYFQKTLLIAQRTGVSLAAYPEYAEYGEYLKEFSTMDLEAVLEELPRAEDDLYNRVLTTGDQKQLRVIDRFVRLLERAYAIRLSTEEFEEFEVNDPDFQTYPMLAFLNRKLAEMGEVSGLLAYHDHLEAGKEALKLFYEVVALRDDAFVANIGKSLAAEKAKIAFLITGGYHTPNMNRLLREKGYSYVVLTPKISADTDQERYEDRLLEPFDAKASNPLRDLAMDAAASAARNDKVKAARAVDDALKRFSAPAPLSSERVSTASIDGTRQALTVESVFLPAAIRQARSARPLRRERALRFDPAPAAPVSGPVQLSGTRLALPKSESDGARLAATRVIGFFPGLGSRDAYRNLGSELYDTGIPEVVQIYKEAAEALGLYKNEATLFDSELDPSRLFLMDKNLPQDSRERQGWIGAAFVVHNLALHAYLTHSEESRKFPVEFSAYTGESFGILIAAAAAGSLSVGDAVKLAQFFTPCLLETAEREIKEEYHVISVRGENLQAFLEDKDVRPLVEVHKFYSGSGPEEQVNVYVAASELQGLYTYAALMHPTLRIQELKPPTRFIAHSHRMAAARKVLDAFIRNQKIEFREPKVPIISNNGTGLLTTAEAVRNGYLALADEVMNSQETVRLADAMEADMIVEIGVGGRTRELVQRNYAATPYFEFSGPESIGSFYTPAAFSQLLYEHGESLKSAQGEDLGDRVIPFLRDFFISSRENPDIQRMLMRYIRQTVKAKTDGSGAVFSAAFQRYIEILQNTYLAQYVLGMTELTADTLVLQTIFKKRLTGTDDKIDIELLTLNTRDETRQITFNQYKYPEVVKFTLYATGLDVQTMALKTARLIKANPRAAELYKELASEIGETTSYFTQAEDPGDAQRNALREMAYQYVMFKMTELYRPALMGQNYFVLEGLDRVGILAAMVAGQAISFKNAAELYKKPGIPLPSIQNSLIKIVRPGTNYHVKSAADMMKIILQMTTAMDNRAPINAQDSWVLTFDPSKSVPAQSPETAEQVIHVRGLNDLWRPNLNAQLDLLETLSILRLTDQNGLVYRFAEGRGVTTSIVYNYINAGEKVVGFGTGGSESLTVFIKKPGSDEVVVRKVLSERLITAFWDRDGKDVMLPPFEKAVRQAEYLQGLPESAQSYFPRVYNVKHRDLPIPPGTPEAERFKGAYHEFSYEMSFLPGMEVSEFVRKHKPSPEVVARLYQVIFETLKKHVHTHRRARPQGPTLERSYFTKIEQRLALSQRTAPNVFTEKLLNSEFIIINGKQYRNIRTLLREFRSHPEYLAALEPNVHSLVMGDTNTENIKIVRPEVLLNAMAKNDLSFTAEDIGITFLDPRAIGFHVNGVDTGADDPMYDNKPWHNSTGNYDYIHGEFFDLTVNAVSHTGPPSLTITEHADSPYSSSYDGIEQYFKTVMEKGWGVNEAYLKEDPYWVIRYVFMMGTHFAAMPPFHFKLELDGSLFDDYSHQRRPVAIYTQGIIWLNEALDMLEGKKTEYMGFQVPSIPPASGARLAEAQLAPLEARPMDPETAELARQLGVVDAAAGARLVSDSFAPMDLSKMSTENRAITSPWMRLVRGTGLGQYPINFDPAIAANLRRAQQAMDEKVSKKNHHNIASSLTLKLTLDFLDPAAPKPDIVSKTDEIIAEIRQIRHPYQFATATAVLIDVFAKLGLDTSALVNSERNVIREAVHKARLLEWEEDKNKGEYERLTALASLITAAGQAGLGAYLTSDEDFVSEALNLIDQVPDAYYRGRGAAMLFTALAAAGYGERAYFGPRDYVRETLDYMNANLDRPGQPLKLRPIKTAYPVFTMMSAIAMLEKPEYLLRGRDWVETANWIQFQFGEDGANFNGMGQYYLMALHNLGLLDKYVPDVKAFLADALARIRTTRYAGPLYVNMNVTYNLETPWLFGHPEFITEEMIRKNIENLTTYLDKDRGWLNTAYGSSYVLTVLGELGQSHRLFTPHPAFGGEEPLLWVIRNFSDGAVAESGISLPYLHHALISFALRMRGADAPESTAFRSLQFLREAEAGARLATTAVTPAPTTTVPIVGIGRPAETIRTTASPDAPVFLLKGATIGEQEAFLKKYLQTTPLGMPYGNEGPFVTDVSIETKRSDANVLFVRLSTITGYNLYFRLGKGLPPARSDVLQMFNVGFGGQQNEYRKELGAGYASRGNLSEDMLLALIKLAKQSGIVRIDEKLGIKGSEKFFEKMLGTNFKRFHADPGNVPYSIINAGYGFYGADDEFIPVYAMTVDLLGFNFPENLAEERTRARASASVSSVGFFPGFASRSAYKRVAAELYDRAKAENNAAVLSIFERGAQAAGLLTDGRPDPSIFFDINRWPKDPGAKVGLTAAFMLVYNLALEADLKRRSDIAGTPVRFTAYTGESVGIVAAAVAAGSLSLEDAIKFVTVMVPKFSAVASRSAGQLHHIVRLYGPDLNGVLTELNSRFGLDFDIHRYHADRPGYQEVHAFVAESALPAVTELIRSRPELQMEEAAPSTHNLMHSRKLGNARAYLEKMLGESPLRIGDPKTPIISNSGKDFLRTAAEVRNAILDLIDRPMYSSRTMRLADEAGNDSILEIGLGGRTRAIAEQNGIQTAYFEITGNDGASTFLNFAANKNTPRVEGARLSEQMRYANGPRDFRTESLVFPSPWIRLIRGAALGQHPVNFDPAMATNLRRSMSILNGGVRRDDNRHRFFSMLMNLILDENDPSRESTPDQVRARVREAVAVMRDIGDPFAYVNAATVLFGVAAKMGWPADWFVNAEMDLVQESLDRWSSIDLKGRALDGQAEGKESYEKMVAGAALFLGIGQMGLRDRLISTRDYVKEALDLLSDIPAAFYRGRGGSAIFSALASIGLHDSVFGKGRDYLAETLDYLDETVDGGSNFKKSYPVFTMINAIAALGKNEYLMYRRDWVREADDVLKKLSPRARANQAEYYLMALHNTGRMKEFVPDVPKFLKEMLVDPYMDFEATHAPNSPMFRSSDDTYIVETSWMFGKLDMVPQEIWSRLLRDFARYDMNESYTNVGWGAAYVLTMMGESGTADSLFRSNPLIYRGQPPFFWAMSQYASRPEIHAISLPYLDHALISYALRMRGRDAEDPPNYVRFAASQAAQQDAAEENERKRMRLQADPLPKRDAEIIRRATNIMSDALSQQALKTVGAGKSRVLASGSTARGIGIFKIGDERADFDFSIEFQTDKDLRRFLDNRNFKTMQAVMSRSGLQVAYTASAKRLAPVMQFTVSARGTSILMEVYLYSKEGGYASQPEARTIYHETFMRQISQFNAADRESVLSGIRRMKREMFMDDLYDRFSKVLYEQLVMQAGGASDSGMKLASAGSFDKAMEWILRYAFEPDGRPVTLEEAWRRGFSVSYPSYKLDMLSFMNEDSWKDLAAFALRHRPAAQKAASAGNARELDIARFINNVTSLTMLRFLSRATRDRGAWRMILPRKDVFQMYSETGMMPYALSKYLYAQSRPRQGAKQNEFRALIDARANQIRGARLSAEAQTPEVYSDRDLQNYFAFIREQLINGSISRIDQIPQLMLDIQERAGTYVRAAPFVRSLAQDREIGLEKKNNPLYRELTRWARIFSDRAYQWEGPGADSVRATPSAQGARLAVAATSPESDVREPVRRAIADLGLDSQVNPENIRIVTVQTSREAELIRRLNDAVESWVLDKRADIGEATSFSEEDLAEMIQLLVRDYRAEIDELILAFEDTSRFPKNANFPIGGKLGQPTIFLNGWRPGLPSRIHDHGLSKAAYHVYKGELKDVAYWRGRNQPVYQEKTTILPAGSTVSMSPAVSGKPHIHQVGSAMDEGTMISINAYYPQLVLMNRYNPSGDGGLVFGGQWRDDEVLHEVKFLRTAANELQMDIERGAIDDWMADDRKFPGYFGNALAMTILFTVLEDKGISSLELIKKGYGIETIDRWYLRQQLSSENVRSRIMNASRRALQALAAGEPLPEFLSSPEDFAPPSGARMSLFEAPAPEAFEGLKADPDALTKPVSWANRAKEIANRVAFHLLLNAMGPAILDQIERETPEGRARLAKAFGADVSAGIDRALEAKDLSKKDALKDAALYHESATVRAQAVRALAQLVGRDEALTRLFRFRVLREPHSLVREAFVNALGSLAQPGDPMTIRFLERVAQHGEGSPIGIQAQRSLDALRGARLATEVKRTIEVDSARSLEITISGANEPHISTAVRIVLLRNGSEVFGDDLSWSRTLPVNEQNPDAIIKTIETKAAGVSAASDDEFRRQLLANLPASGVVATRGMSPEEYWRQENYGARLTAAAPAASVADAFNRYAAEVSRALLLPAAEREAVLVPAYRVLLDELLSLLEKDGKPATFVYPFMGLDGVPAVLRETRALNIPFAPNENSEREAILARAFPADVRDANSRLNILGADALDAESYAGLSRPDRPPYVFLLKGFALQARSRGNEYVKDLLRHLFGNVLREGDAVMILDRRDKAVEPFLRQNGFKLAGESSGLLQRAQLTYTYSVTETAKLDTNLLFPDIASVFIKGARLASPAPAPAEETPVLRIEANEFLHEISNFVGFFKSMYETASILFPALKQEGSDPARFYEGVSRIYSLIQNARAEQQISRKTELAQALALEAHALFTGAEMKSVEEFTREAMRTPTIQKGTRVLKTEDYLRPILVYARPTRLYLATAIGAHSEGAVPVDLIDTLEAYVRAQKGFESIRFSHMAGNIYIVTDEVALFEVLTNLLKNALEATNPESRNITVTTRLSNVAGYIEIEVRDNGSGMSKETLDKLFTPYFTTKGAQGTGLGLATSQRLVHERLGGTISVTSVLGEGSAFLLHLPIEASGARLASLNPSPRPYFSSFRVMPSALSSDWRKVLWTRGSGRVNVAESTSDEYRFKAMEGEDFLIRELFRGDEPAGMYLFSPQYGPGIRIYLNEFSGTRDAVALLSDDIAGRPETAGKPVQVYARETAKQLLFEGSLEEWVRSHGLTAREAEVEPAAKKPETPLQEAIARARETRSTLLRPNQLLRLLGRTQAFERAARRVQGSSARVSIINQQALLRDWADFLFMETQWLEGYMPETERFGSDVEEVAFREARLREKGDAPARAYQVMVQLQKRIDSLNHAESGTDILRRFADRFSTLSFRGAEAPRAAHPRSENTAISVVQMAIDLGNGSARRLEVEQGDLGKTLRAFLAEKGISHLARVQVYEGARRVEPTQFTRPLERAAATYYVRFLNVVPFEAGRKFASQYNGARLSQETVESMEVIRSAAGEEAFLEHLMAFGLTERGLTSLTPVYLKAGNALIRLESAGAEAHLILYRDPESSEPIGRLTRTRERLEEVRKQSRLSKLEQSGVRKLALEAGVAQEEIQIGRQATRLANELAERGIVRTDVPVFNLINLDDRLQTVPADRRPAYLELLASQIERLRAERSVSAGILRNSYYAFYSEDPALMKSLVSDAPPQGAVNYSYHGKPSASAAVVSAAWTAVLGKTPAKAGFVPIEMPAGAEEFSVLPTQAEMVWSAVVAGLDLQKISLPEAQRHLDALMRVVVNRVSGSSELIAGDIESLQQFVEGYKRYPLLAVRAVEKIDLEQIFAYIQGARLAAGTSA